MRRVNETEATLLQIADSTGRSLDRVRTVVSALRDAIDGLFLDGYTIFAPPFSLTYPNDPVAPVFAERIADASDADIEAWKLGDTEATAQWLGIPLSVYLRHPVASDLRVLIDLLDTLGIDDADGPEGTAAVAIAEAWFDTFAEERRYRLSSVGLERDLEAWVIHNTECLVAIGYDVRLMRQQFVLPDRRRPDLVFDLVESDGSLGTLVVELKATGGYLGAVDQLVGYLDAFRSLGLANGVLRGLLVADGFPHDVLLYADEKGIDTATLTELGYRRDLGTSLGSLTTARPADDEGNDMTSRNRRHPDTHVVYLAWGMSAYDPQAYEESASDPVPFLRLILDEQAGSVSDVEAVGTSGWEYTAAKEAMAEATLTPSQLCRFFGSSCYVVAADPSIRANQSAGQDTRVEMDNQETEIPAGVRRSDRRIARRGPDESTSEAVEVRASRVYQMFHAMDTDQNEPQATLVFAGDGICTWVSNEDPFATLADGHIFTLTLDEIAGVMTSRVFVPVGDQEPADLDATDAAKDFAHPWEASVRATEAAADFLRAVWETRKDITVLPPRHLARYLQSNPAELQGDDDLPEHIRTAADAIEDLPRAVNEWTAPDGYGGGVEAFLLDAERLFLSISRRLRHVQSKSVSTA